MSILMRRLAPSLLLLTAACTVGPDYTPPPVEAPKGYKSAAEEDLPYRRLDPDWWKLFGDSILSDLEAQAILANQDIQQALARVTEARAAARIAGSALYPTVSAGGLAQRERTSANSARAGGRSTTTSDFLLPLDFGYEVDVWGRVRRSIESASAETQASEADLVVVTNSVEADIATNYFTLRSLDSQLEILRRTVDVYRNQLTLLETQFNAGLVGRITIVQQETQLFTIVTQEVEFRRQRADVEHAIAILLGRAPSELSIPPAPLTATPPRVPSGLPSELLRRRPDVAQAERLLASATAQIGIAASQYYPQLRLTGQMGLESGDLRHLFEWESRIWSLAASAVVTLFAGGQIDATVDAARARADQALAGYRNRVLAAFRDVEDALSDLHLRAEASEAQAKAVASAKEYVTLSETQFTQGLVSYLQVTDSQRSLLLNELSAAQILNQRFIATVLLIKALGAGWEPEFEPERPRQ